jgi:hypothetical protein
MRPAGRVAARIAATLPGNFPILQLTPNGTRK